MVKKSALALCSLALFAAVFPLSASAQGSHVTVGSQAPAPPPCILPCIYNNFGPPIAKWVVIPFTGYPILGATAPSGPVYIAMPFIPTANSAVKHVYVPVQWSAAGDSTHGFEISIYSDNSGLPGTALATKQEVAITTFPACCVAADRINANFAPGVKVVAGTQYWVVVDTIPAGDTLTQDVWAWAPFPGTVFAYNLGGGWVFVPFGPSPAMRVTD
jgi:hypothetical protein